MLNERNTLLEDDGIEEEILVEEECSVAQAVWGDIQGNIENQTDLQNALDAKQDSLTEAQLNAVNSGITAEKVTTYDGYADQIASKANQSALNAEATTREQADNALGGRIDTEIHDRQVADNGLQSQIDAITSKSDVVDVVANYAALQAYDTSSLGNNDVIKVLDDETHEDALTYYRWSTTTQTWTYIGQEAPYYSKSQTDTLLLGKQNTIDSSHKLSADLVDDTSTTNKFVTASDITNWNGKQDALTAGTGIDITSGIISTPAIVPEVVTELPTTGAEGKLYLTPKAHTTLTATGNPIEATITAQAGQLESFQLDGNTFQQSYEGKNLFDKTNPPSVLIGASASELETGLRITQTTGGQWKGCIYVLGKASDVAGQTINVHAIATESASNRPFCQVSLCDASGGNRVLVKNSDSSEIDIVAVMPVNPSREYYCLTLDSNGSGTGNIGDYIDYEEIMIYLGSTSTDYEPYVGGVPSPNPDYPQQIQTVTGEQTVNIRSKNLFVTPPSGENRGVTYTRNQDGTYSITGKATGGESFISATTDKITIQNGDSIYLSSTSDNAVLHYRVEAYNGNTWLSVIAAQSYNMPIVVSLPSNTTRLRFGIGIADGAEVNLSNVGFQLEKSSTATAYTPYISTDYPISLGSLELCKLGTYQDYIYKDGESWKVHKAVEKLQLVSSQGWAKSGTMTTLDRYFIRDYFPSGTIPSDLSAIVVRSNYFTAISQSASDSGSYGICQLNGRGLMINTALGAFSSNDAFRNWLDSNSVNAYYALATATDATITDTNLIAQLEAICTASLQNGTNTITNTATGTNLAGDMEIGYFEFNPTNRYDKWLWLNLNNNYEQIGGE